MRWVTANQRELQINSKADEIAQPCPSGFEQPITRRAVHELLYQPLPGNSVPFFPALMATRAVMKSRDKDAFSPSPMYPWEREKELLHRLVWVDPTRTFYPPAMTGLGISLDQIHILRPRPADVVWATIEALRSRSIATVIASITHPLTRVEVRRLQLAAEAGGGIAILIRPNLTRAANHIYAAATRWLVAPMPGERTIQRWRLELVHGHGRQIGQSFILEKNRATGQTYFVHPPAALVHHPAISAAS